jgi:hypothetical protein
MFGVCILNIDVDGNIISVTKRLCWLPLPLSSPLSRIASLCDAEFAYANVATRRKRGYSGLYWSPRTPSEARPEHFKRVQAFVLTRESKITFQHVNLVTIHNTKFLVIQTRLNKPKIFSEYGPCCLRSEEPWTPPSPAFFEKQTATIVHDIQI